MNTFSELVLHPQLLQAIDKLGFTTPTPIQQQVLTHTLQGHDAIGRAQTGTGKTAAFLITIINDLLTNPPSSERYRGEPRALILAPTRELALQIEQDAKELLTFTGLSVVTLFGGVDYVKQQKALDRSFVDIIVATPGRLLDFINQKEVYLDQIELLVIDEADRLMDMGFIVDIKRILRYVPTKENRQSLMFSATFNRDILSLAKSWLFDPISVEIEPEQKTNESVDQRVIIVSKREKLKLLKHLLQSEKIDKAMIFANRRDQVKRLYDTLKTEGYQVGILSGDITQDRRMKMLEQFKRGKTQIMIATDVAGRGIHVDGVSHVFNYTLPEQPDDYVHRIGRTGRAGALGVSISFACEDDSFMLEDIEKAIEKKLPLERLEGF